VKLSVLRSVRLSRPDRLTAVKGSRFLTVAVPYSGATEPRASASGPACLLHSVLSGGALNMTKSICLAVLGVALSASSLCAVELSSYRDFQLGTTLQAVAKQVEMKPSEARVVHERPELIQELEWQPRRLPGPSSELDSVDQILFSFYNGQLFRMLVNYDRRRTDGMTLDDMIEAISAKYGLATRGALEINFPSSYNKTVAVMARWEDTGYAFNLIHSAYQPGFALVVLSKGLDGLAQTAAVAAIRLDDQEAPQREIDRQKKQVEDARIQQDNARLANKPGFRP
jgi:hypothetical protein